MAQSHRHHGRNTPDRAEEKTVELPIVLEDETDDDFLAEMVHEECVCGSSIAKHTAQKHAGVHHVECVACGVTHYQG